MTEQKSPRELAGRVVLVTGGARRVGAAIVRELAAAGASVVIHYHRSRAAAEQLAAELERAGTRALALAADLARPEEAAALAEAAAARLDRLDGLVLSAAEFTRTPFARITPEDWERVLRMNLIGPFFLARRAADLMRKQSPPGGAIVAVADLAAFRPYRRWLPYSVSKAALLALVRGLALELAPTVRVNAVAPHAVLPPDPERAAPGEAEAFARAQAQAPLAAAGVAGRPEDVARAVRFLLAEPSFVTGTVLPLDGGRLLA